jgi:hypothetical protein|tara:strand:+ start:500 stop:1342 length:843 start_codon:yes stop_codon:yes gene_type:complete
MVSNNDLYSNIINNKIFLNIKNGIFSQSVDNIISNKEDFNEIFSNISLSYIKKNINYDILENNVRTLIKPKAIDNETLVDNELYKYIDDSFLTQLMSITFKENRELRNEFKDFVNSNNNIDYLKTINRSYKKFRIDIHNILLNQNLDTLLTDNLFTIICKVLDINIIILYNKKKIYKLYEIIDNTSSYYVFNKYIRNIENVNRDGKVSNKLNINYMFHKTINNNELNEFLKNKNKFISDKELKNMKIQELRELSNKNNINSIQKKLDLIQELSLIYKEFN